MRFVHIADVHLDTPFSSRSPVVRDRLREATRGAFRAAVDLALKHEVHALLIAGDLFDGDRISFQTERFLVSQLARLTSTGIQVVYATGNHDPGTPGSRSLEIAWPEGVTVVAGAEPRRVRVEDRSGAAVGHVTAAGHETARESRDLAAGFPVPDGTVPEVGLLHTQVVGSVDEDAHHPYAPSALDRLTGAGYHYWALGHVHHRQVLSRRPAVHYPGNPQGRTPREDGPRGGLLVDLSDPDHPSATFHVLGPVRWARLRVSELGECRNLDDVVEVVARAWEDSPGARAAGTTETLLQLTLTGGSPLWRMFAERDELEALAQAVAGRLGLLWVDILPPRTHPVVEVSEHVDRPDVLGETLRLVDRILRRQEEVPELTDHELASPALRQVADRDAYVRSLLEGAQEDLLSRMLRRGEPTRTGDP